MNIGKKLETLRKQKGLTQLELAEKVHVSRQAISRWEVGAAVPSTDNLKILSDIYGVSVDDILHDEVMVVAQESGQAEVLLEKPQNPETPKKSGVFFACVSILLVLTVMVIASIASSYNMNKDMNFPMENLTSEEDDGRTETFSFE